MENQDTNNIYNLYREAYSGAGNENFLDPGLNRYIASLSDDEKQTLIEYHFNYAIEDNEDIDYVLNQLLIEHEPDIAELQADLDYYNDRGPRPEKSPGRYGSNPDMRPFSRKDENAEEGGGSMRGYMEDELVSAFEGDGVMGLREFMDLGVKYVSALHRFDAGDLDIRQLVSMVGDGIGMDLEIHRGKVMLADYIN
jgi:hypothetical protein